MFMSVSVFCIQKPTWGNLMKNGGDYVQPKHANRHQEWSICKR